MNFPASGEGALARVNLIYVGPLDDAHRVSALAEAFISAREHDPRLHLLLVGDGELRSTLMGQLGHGATFLGELGGSPLPELAEHLDLLISPTTAADTAQTIADAQRCGLPVLAVEGGSAASLIENGRSGFLVPDSGTALSDAIRWLSRRATLRERLAIGGRVATGGREAPPYRAGTGHPSGPERIMTA